MHVVGNSSELQGGSSMEQSRQQLDVSHTCATITLKITPHLKRASPLTYAGIAQGEQQVIASLAAGDNQVPVSDDQPSEDILPAADYYDASSLTS